MYGLINMAIKQLIKDQLGEDGWQTVKMEAQLEDDSFELLTPYDDGLTYKLIGAASKASGKPAHEILHLFGTYWIQYAVSAGYGPLIQLFGPTYKECLSNLNKMHDHMGAMMPGLVPPVFDIEKEISPTEFILNYTSTRSGLAPMVLGLLKTLAQRYGISEIETTHLGKTENNLSDRFLIKWQ